jgi:hypothetical protein
MIPIVDAYIPATCTYEAYRWACTPGCAKAYIIQAGSTDLDMRLMHQRQLLVDAYGWPVDKPIPIARSWEELDVDGGHMSVEEWRDTCETVKSCVRHISVVPHKVVVEIERDATAEDLLDGATEDDPSAALALFGSYEGSDALDSLSTEGLRRPPDEDNVATEEQLVAKHGAEMVVTDDGYFAKFLAEGNLPSEETCKQLMADYKAEKKATRKRNKDAVDAARAGEEEEDDDDDDESDDDDNDDRDNSVRRVKIPRLHNEKFKGATGEDKNEASHLLRLPAAPAAPFTSASTLSAATTLRGFKKPYRAAVAAKRSSSARE